YEVGAGVVDYVIDENIARDNSFFGIVVQDGTGRVEKNRVQGAAVGIAVVADAENSTAILRENSIHGTTVARTQTIQCCGFVATIGSGSVQALTALHGVLAPANGVTGALSWRATRKHGG